MYWGSGESHGFANIVRIKEECWNFLWGVISGGTVESRFKKARFKKESRFKKDCWYNRFFST